jgi:hypothetical protein
MKRILFGLYATYGFIVVSGIPTLYNPKIYNTMQEKSLQYWWDFRPEYPLGFYILLVAIPLFLLICFAPQIMRILDVTDNAINRPIYLFACFFGIVLASLFNFRWDPIFLFWGFSYGGLLAVIDGLQVYALDFTFIERQEIPNEPRVLS